MLFAACLLTAALGNDGHLGAPIPTGAVALPEAGRYDVPRSYDDTLEFYRYHFKRESSSVRWRNIVSLPHVRAKFLQSMRPKTAWQGINVYEKGGKVRIFVVPRDPKATQGPDSGS